MWWGGGDDPQVNKYVRCTHVLFFITLMMKLLKIKHSVHTLEV